MLHHGIRKFKNLSGKTRFSILFFLSGVSFLSLVVYFSYFAVTQAAGPYHVRIDGSDTGCTGLVDAVYPGSGTGQACAFRTIQKASDTILPGEDILIHPGTYAPFTLRGANQGGTFKATAGNPTVIEGVSSNTVIIDGTGAQSAIFSAGSSGSVNGTAFVTFQHMRLMGGTTAALHLQDYHYDIVINDIYIDSLGYLTPGREVANPPRAGIMIHGGGTFGGSGGPTNRITIDGVTIIGNNTDANAINLYASNSVVRNSYASGFLGDFVMGSSQGNNIFEDNVVKNMSCDSDDGCIQVYNNLNYIIRRNVFDNVIPSGPVARDYNGVVGIRATLVGQGTPLSTSASIYNNTFIGNSLRNSGYRNRAIAMHVENVSTPTVESVIIKNNIFMYYGSNTQGGGIYDGGAITVQNHCPPTQFSVSNNFFYGNTRNMADTIPCIFSTNNGTQDFASSTVNPQLDPVTYIPATGSPVCSGGDGAYASYIGAKACPAAVPGTYHVSTLGSDTGCNGSLPDPYPGSGTGLNCAFRNPQKGVDAVQSGQPNQKVLIHAGTYSTCTTNSQSKTAIFSVMNKSGVSGSPIVIKGAGDGAVNFSGTCQYGAYLFGSSYVTVGGTGTNEGITFGSNFALDTVAYPTGGTVTGRQGTNISVLGNTFLGLSTNFGQNDSTEISLFDAPAAQNAEIAYNTISCAGTHYCIVIGDTTGCGSLVAGGNCLRVDNAKVHHNTILETVQDRRIGIRSRGCGNCEFYNNYINLGTSALPTGNATAGSLGIQTRDNVGSRIYNNYFYVYDNSISNGSAGIESYESGVSGVVTEGHLIYNNTVYGRGDRGLKLGDCDNCEIRNNLLLGFSGTSVWNVGFDCVSSSGGGWGYNALYNVNSSNLWYGSSGGASCQAACSAQATTCDADTTNKYTAPPVVGSGNVPTPFLQLTSALGPGIQNASTPAVDYDGDARSSPPDIGADEYSGGCVDFQAPLTPSIFTFGVNGSGQPTLNWSAVSDNGCSGTKDYVIKRSTTSGSGYTQIGTATGLTYTDASVAANTTYYYVISARDNALNESANSSQVSMTTPNTVTITLRQGLNSYTGTRDTSIREAASSMNYGIDSELPVGMQSSAGTHRRSFLSFDLSSIPSGSTILQAQLTLMCYSAAQGASYTISGYRALRPWADTSATWNVYATGLSWGAPGASSTSDYGSKIVTIGSFTTCVATPTASTVDVSSTVQNWVNGTWSNYGWFLMNDSDNTLSSFKSFASAEHATAAWRPTLTITYIPAVTGDTTQPAQITNLTAITSTTSTVTLTWSATGDDGSAGTATSYDLRYGTSTITSGNWTGATQATGEPTPQIASSAETMIVSGLNANTTYYFAIKALDEANNSSTLSNVTSIATLVSGGAGANVCPNNAAFSYDNPLPGSPEGYGANTTGGTGQSVVCVTNLNDSGVGSLRDALSGSNRRVYFGVGGSITLSSVLELRARQNVTIDGSTAYSLGGITLSGYPLSVRDSNNVIVRHLRHAGAGFTNQPGFEVWCPATGNCSNFWLDHLTTYQATDDPVLVYQGATDATISWTLVHNTQGLAPKAMNVSGPNAGPIADRVTIHHNVMTTNAERHPQVMGLSASVDTKPLVDIRNNVMHDWTSGSTPTANYGTRFRRNGRGNIVKNIYFSNNNPNNAIVLGLAGDTVGPGLVYTNGNEAQQVNINSIGNSGSVVGNPPSISEDDLWKFRRPLGSNVLLDMNLVAGTGVGAFPRAAVDNAAIAAVAADIIAPADTTPPSPVTFTTPTDGATVSGTSVPVSVSASDPESGVSGVVITYPVSGGGTDSVSLSGSPYMFTWDASGLSGNQTLTAEATNAEGLSTIVSITVNVDNGGGGPGPGGTPSAPPEVAGANSVSFSDGGGTGAYEVSTNVDVIPDSLGFCPAGMVWVPAPANFCIDKYEQPSGSSVYVASYGSAASVCGTETALQNNTVVKRLPLAYEWWLAALGTPDDASCNISAGPFRPPAISSCRSKAGAYDMIGNVDEWVSDSISISLTNGYVVGVDSQGFPRSVGTLTEAQSVRQYYADDQVYVNGSTPAEVARGGKSGEEAGAGIYTVRFNPGTAGFRCVAK